VIITYCATHHVIRWCFHLQWNFRPRDGVPQ